MTIQNKSLEQRIEESVEQLVREHVASLEEAAAEASRRAFRRAIGSTSKGRRESAREPTKALRSRDEMEALEEALYRAVCTRPGEGMAVLAEAVKSTPRKLNRPMIRLRDAGRIRSVGQRQRTRYFPIGD